MGFRLRLGPCRRGRAFKTENQNLSNKENPNQTLGRLGAPAPPDGRR